MPHDRLLPGIAALHLCSPQALRLLRLLPSGQASFLLEHSLPVLYVQPSPESLLGKTSVGAKEVLSEGSCQLPSTGKRR